MDKTDQVNTIISGDSSILWQGFVKDLDDSVVTVYSLHLANITIWFVATEVFLENECDFYIKISNFGLRKKSDAECSKKSNRMVFSKQEAEVIQIIIERFFTSQDEKDFFPFNIKKANFVKVVFSHEWILT